MSDGEFIWSPLYADAADNPKWGVISTLTGEPVERVWAVWSQMLCPSRWAVPGALRDDAIELIAAALRIPFEAVDRIYAAMQGRTLLGNQLKGWEKRRLGRRDEARPSSAAIKPATLRQRRRRAIARGHGEPELDFRGAVTPESRPSVTPSVTGRDSGVTQGVTGNADVTPFEPELVSFDQDLAGDVTPVTTESESEIEEEALPLGASRARAGAPSVVPFPDRKRSLSDAGPRHDNRPCPIPVDWQPDPDDWAYATSRGYDDRWIADQAERFRDHYRATGEPRGDWHAQWRRWVQFAPDFERGRGARGGPGGGGPVARPVSVLAAGAEALARLEMGQR